MMKPKVSVIIPVYNREQYIAEAIQSAINQACSSIEIIVVDDGSTDGTPEVVSQFKTIKIITQSNQGVAAARNTGLAHASGEHIAFVDSDDICMPKRFRICLDHFAKNPETDFIVGKEQMFLEKNTPQPDSINPEWLAGPRDAWNTAVLFARKSCFETAGMFNTNYISGEDTEWFFRAIGVGLKYVQLPDVLIKRRIHSTNLSIERKKFENKMLFQVLRESVQRKLHNK